MNDLHKSIYDKVVAPALRNRRHNVKGTILLFDSVANRAIVTWFEGNGTKVTRAGVPVALTGGVVSAGPFPGDTVWIEFTNGDRQAPKIVAMADYDYTDNTRETRTKHQRKGAYIPETLSYL